MRHLEDPSEQNVFKRSNPAPVVKRLFLREAALIRRGWLSRIWAYPKLSPAEQLTTEAPEDWMLRTTYRLVRWLIRCGHQEILSDLVDDEVGTRHGSRNDVSDQPFKLALLAMFWWSESLSNETVIDRRRRAEFGDAMEYASRHRVPSKHLCGFIKQAGIKRIAHKLKVGHCEPGFRLGEPHVTD